MTIEAQLDDGRVLEFPDGTDPTVIQATVKKMIAGSAPQQAPAAQPSAAPAAQPTPTVTPSQTAKQQFAATVSKPTLLEEATGAVAEPILKMGSALIAKPVSEVAGIAAMFSDFLGGKKDGDPLGFQKHVQESLTYSPRTTAGASDYNPLNAVPNAIGKVASAIGTPVKAALKGDASNDSARGMAVNALSEAVPQALGMIGVKNAPLFGKAVSKTGQVVGEVAGDIAKNRAVTTQLAKEAASDTAWNRATVIEAAKVGRKNNLTMNPATVNPSKSATIANAAVNSDYFNAAASINNAPKFNQMVREELGIPKNTVLDAKAFEAAKTRISAPYREAAKIQKIVPDAALTAELRAIEIPSMMGTSAADAGRIKHLTDSVAKSLDDGVSASEMMKTIQSFRKEANSVDSAIRKGDRLDPTVVAEGKAKRQIADILDKQLQANVTPELAKSLEAARVKLAQLHQHKKATDFATGQVDPFYYANELKNTSLITGAGREMGEFAANMPAVSDVFAKKVGTKIHLPARSGMAGTAGYAVGTLAGTPVAASAVSAGLASLGGKLHLKKMLSDEYQSKNLVPIDRRIPLPTPQQGMMTGTP